MRKRQFDHDHIRALSYTMSALNIAKQVGCSYQTVLNVLRTQVQPSETASTKSNIVPIRQSVSRFAHEPLSGQTARLPSYDHAALTEKRTIYPSTVHRENEVKNALKSGINSSKIGGIVKKGRWKGMPVFTLTLEERSTCPISCRHWRSCYGNNMHLAERLAHGDDLIWRLEREVGWLDLQHRNGFVVRLHVLGDFYSVEYVEFWARMLATHKALHVFGFTARHDYQRDPIARAIIDLATKDWSRFAIRLSNAPIDQCSTVSIEHPLQAPPDTIVCPAQLGKTESCSTCALCWQSMKRIAFIQH